MDVATAEITALPPEHPLRSGRTSQSPMVLNCRGRRTAHRPVWFMRQAGRSLPEYRAARHGIAMLDACLNPELAAELTVQPVRRHGVDAAVLFSDIMVPLALAGVDVDIVPGRGPVLASAVRTAADIAALPRLDPAALAPVAAAARIVAGDIGGVPLVGFAGGPFTVASYLVEGGPSRDHLRTRAMMHADPVSWHALATWVASVSATFLRAQVMAGASVVQVFDSWAGGLSQSDYHTFVAPHAAAIFADIGALGVPRIHFGVGTGGLLTDFARAGADVVGIDYRTDLASAVRQLGGHVPVQGNIDPAVVLAGAAVARAATRAVLDAAADAPGHIVNLGHGVPPDADPGVLTSIVETVHAAPDPRG